MNTEELKGKWQQVKGKVRETWGKITDDDLDIIAGREEKLIGKVRERYGYAKDRAEAEVNRFLSSCSCGSEQSRTAHS